MSDNGDQELIALIAREQRGFRFVMYFGVAVLIAMALMSAGLGLYYRQAQQDITRTVEEQAFRARRADQDQNTEITNQRNYVRRIADELSRLGGAGGSSNTSDAMSAARAFLERGRLGLTQERLIEASAHADATPPAERSLLEGVVHLMAFNRSGENVQPGDPLPQRLEDARSAFQQIQDDAALGPLAHNGIAFVLNSEAQRVSYTEEACQNLFDTIAASVSAGGELAPRSLFWRANCERKLGQTGEALRDYSAMLTQSAGATQSRDADYADLELAMNGFHGVGTTLIALHGTSDANLEGGLAVARRECGAGEQAEHRSPEMQLAIACLSRAMALRRQMGQSPSQVAGGTGENMGFAYLRDNDFTGALDHANRIEDDSLSAWNELVRAIAAEHMADTEGEQRDAARRAANEARQNISFFTPREFDLCEVRRLLNTELYDEAVAIVSEEHRGRDMPTCTD